MDSSELLKRLYKNPTKPITFDFSLLQGPMICQVLTPKDVGDLYDIATSIRLNGDINKKYKLIKEILERRGFRYLGAGTNRVVYKYLEDPNFVIKVAVDNVGLSDNPAEYKNQWLLQPFCTRVFDVDPTGVVATVERVQGIQNIEEYMLHADDILLLINNVIGKYVLEDIGCKFFRNVGIRTGYGPVFLDYPYVYELDGGKLYCNFITEYGQSCNGEIDYDDGYNFLICKKCGRRYRARELQKSETEAGMIAKKGRVKMRVVAKLGDKIIVDSDTTNASKVFEKSVEHTEIIKEPVVTYTGFKPARDEEVEEKKEETTTRKTSSYDNTRKKADLFQRPGQILTTEMISDGVGIASYTGFKSPNYDVEVEEIDEPVEEAPEVEPIEEVKEEIKSDDTEEEPVEEEKVEEVNSSQHVVYNSDYKEEESEDPLDEVDIDKEGKILINGKDPCDIITEELFGKDGKEESEAAESETSATSEEDPYKEEKEDMKKVDAMTFDSDEEEFDVTSPFMKNALSDDDIAENLRKSMEQQHNGSKEINYTSPEEMYNINNSEGRYPARRKRR